MKEKIIYEHMKLKLRRDKIFLQRFEVYSIPDIFYTKSLAASGWIELKVVNKFSKNGMVKIPFRKGQYPWIKKYTKYSQFIFLFLHIENSLFIFKGDNIIPTYSVSNIHEASCYDILWKNVNWEEVLNLL